MLTYLKDNNYAHMSEGALVVDVQDEDDNKKIPPCLLVKSDGATLYATTDLATIVSRISEYNADEIIYIVDNRQALHFEQIFRCARKTKIVSEDNKLKFIGFGTMNGTEGKPFKTRDGGVMRLETLIDNIVEEVEKKTLEVGVKKVHKEDLLKIAIAAIKYADLSNQINKDYIFDVEKFISFEGNTGPYIQYTVVRINSLLEKINYSKEIEFDNIIEPFLKEEVDLVFKMVQFNEVMETCGLECSPNKLCNYIYELAVLCNRFYNKYRVITEENIIRRNQWVFQLDSARRILTELLKNLAIEVPDEM